MHKPLAFLLALMLLLTGTFSAFANGQEQLNNGEILIASQIEAANFHYMTYQTDIYKADDHQYASDTLPARFDLRERGVFTPIKNQEPWGTCWSFATIAAAEASILSELGMTAEAFEEKYGFAMDLKCFFGSLHVFGKDDSVVEGGTGEMKKQEIESNDSEEVTN